ncbi:haloacid dehalogenase type II [soil metagenome]
MSLEFTRFEALTFDCYGTLIDWETGLLRALRAILAAHAADSDDEALLGAFARHETRLESGPYRLYREILEASAEGICGELGVTPTSHELRAFGASVAAWPAFPDSPDALASLASRFRLGVITNCDDDLFAASNRRLGVTFDVIVTAQQAGGYKPAIRNFELALERLRLPVDRVLHVAQSLYHDHVPAQGLGLATVWVDRRSGRAGSGATPPAEASPDLVVPDMASLARAAGMGAPAAQA